MSDIRDYFPAPVVQIVQKDAFDRLGLQRMLLEPEFLAAVEADINLVANLIVAAQRDAGKDQGHRAAGDRARSSPS